MHHYLNLLANTFRMVQTVVTNVPFRDWSATPNQGDARGETYLAVAY